MFGGGLGLAVIGTFVAGSRRGLQFIAQEGQRRMTSSIEVTIQQPTVFQYVGHYSAFKKLYWIELKKLCSEAEIFDIFSVGKGW